jgi:DNA polymerase-3 subunit alpha
LVERAKLAGFDALALTDHGTVMGAPAFVKECVAAGIKPIVGSELYISVNPLDARPKDKTDKEFRRYVHMVALATCWNGFEELMELISLANEEDHFYYKPRNTFEECAATDHLIFLTACAGGVLSTDYYEKNVVYMMDKVGPGRFFLEIQPHMDEQQILVNNRAVGMSEKHGLFLTATQDFHYTEAKQSQTHEVLLAIGQRKAWSSPDRWKYPVNDLYLKSEEEMMTAFSKMIAVSNLSVVDVLGAVKTTKHIARQCSIEWQKKPISLPDMGVDPTKQLMQACVDGLKAKSLSGNAEYIDRLKYELGVIKDSGFLDYFLVLKDIIGWCGKEGIMVGPARGSSAGSLVCYLIGITRIDPIKHGLLFERFYRPGRIDLPDIDTDFEDERRDEVIAYISQRFGERNVCGVANYNKLGAKQAIKDVCRVFEVGHMEANRATSQVKNGLEDDEVFDEPSIKELFEKHPNVERFARELVGTMRGMGQHAAGIVVSGMPVAKRSAVWRKDGRAVSCWDKRIIEDMGLMKLDVLGLRTLSILRNAAENIKALRGVDIDFDAIPLDDEKSLEVFNEGLTTGVFQFESVGMRGLLRSLNVDQFSVISDSNALFRPGPMDLIPQYQAVQTGKSKPVYDHPLLKEILDKTHGVMIYQEQLMQVFVDIGGFDYAHADLMRKIVGKKLGTEEFSKHEDDFVTGAKGKGVDETVAKNIFRSMVLWADYGFNKSHAVSYSVIAFWCAYLKAHYPAEFFAAHISNSDEAQTAQAVEEAKRVGITIELPDINRSLPSKFAVLPEDKLLAPLTAIKGLGDKAADAIYLARLGEMTETGVIVKRGAFSVPVKAGIFDNKADFEARLYKRVVNTRVRKLLDECGCTPWSEDEYTAEEISDARMINMGHIFKDQIRIDPDEQIVWDTDVKEKLEKLLEVARKSAKERHMSICIPKLGSKARIMLVFPNPSWKDESRGEFGHDDSYEVFRKMALKELSLNKSAFYVTGLHKLTKPPLGYDEIMKESRDILQAEFEIIQPPVVIAFGKDPIEFFAGKGARVGELHGKVVLKGKTPVVCSFHPYQIKIEPMKYDEFVRIADGLRSVYA